MLDYEINFEDPEGGSFEAKHFHLRNDVEYKNFIDLCAKKSIIVLDTIKSQLEELAKITLIGCSPEEILNFVEKETKDSDGFIFSYGTWVYYPWRKLAVHLLPENKFRMVRTNRNREKITIAEQLNLGKKRIGVIGLSVGHSAALTLVQESVCGEIRIADFDAIELSNMNRLRTSIANLGQKKSVVTCREILEMDPYMKVKVYSEGIHNDNIEKFLLADGGLDLVVEECDNLEMKLKIRELSKKYKIPVVMDTSDRGMIDIERFDKDPERDIFHGLLGMINAESVKSMFPAEKKEVIYRILGGLQNISHALKISIEKMGVELVGFSQIASEVHLGGALVTHVARHILLGKAMPSGRYYVDLNEAFSEKKRMKQLSYFS